MYAQLCKRLLNEVPNFQPDQTATSSSTFSIHLLNRCRVEFENRAAIVSGSSNLIIASGSTSNISSNDFDSTNDSISTSNDEDVEERRLVAKSKMLGNIKFICELAKLRILNEAILHKCIQALLGFPSTNLASIPVEDLECLCQIMRTCGRLLDTSKSQRLMDQYFERMKLLSMNKTLTLRIQFLLRDVIDLRNDKWQPRQAAIVEGPKPVSQMQMMMMMTDDEKAILGGGGVGGGGGGVGGGRQLLPPYRRPGGGIPSAMTNYNYLHHKNNRLNSVTTNNYNPYDSGPLSTAPSNGGYYNRDYDYGGGGGTDLFRYPLRSRGGIYDNILIPTTAQNLLPNSPFGGGANGVQREGVGGHLRGMMMQRGQGGFNNNNNNSNTNNMANNNNNNTNFAMNQRGQYRHNQNNNNSQFNQSAKDLAPRFKKNLIVSKEDLGDVELRPNSMLFNKAAINKINPNIIMQNNRNLDTNSTIGYNSVIPPSVLKQSPVVVPSILKEPLPIKQVSVDNKPKQSKKDKGPNKEEIIKKFSSLLCDYWKGEQDLKQTVNLFIDMKVPDKFIKDVILNGLITALDKPEVEQEKLIKLLSNLKDTNTMAAQVPQDCLKPFCAELKNRENEVEKAHKSMAHLFSVAISEHLMKLQDIAQLTENGQNFPLFLLILQQFHEKYGRPVLTDIFRTNKINLLNQLPPNDKTKDRLSDILTEYNLAFLYPLLRIQGELSRQLNVNSNPSEFHAWLRDNYDTTDASFISALTTVLVTFITQDVASNNNNNNNNNNNSKVDPKTIAEKEKNLLRRYKTVIQAFVHDKPDLQLMVLFAVQEYFHSLDFPRGHLLRWFAALEDLDIIDADTFFNWREDITDMYPGKQSALFETNSWFIWLQTAVVEDEDDDE